MGKSAAPSQPSFGSRWEIQLLGGLRVRNGDTVVTRFATRAVVELLALLVLQSSRSHSREELASRLWPDADEAAGRNRLKNALSQLKAVFGRSGSGEAGVIDADRYTVRLLAESVGCDVIDFEAHARRGRHAAARACYHGELLPGFDAGWLHEERLRLAALYDRVSEPEEPARRGSRSEGDASTPMHGRMVSADAGQYRLPSYLTAFFGREKETHELGETLAAHRLVTVTGMGGCGKTRLCIETARRQRQFDLVCLVRLEECGDAMLMADHVREALGLQAGAPSALRQIVANMEGQRLLLVLDGFERLVGDAAAATIEELLERLPSLHLVISSQVALGLAAEREYRLSPLPLPDATASADAAVRNPSIALFLHRAREVRADFNIHARNLAYICALCHAAEGLPLIIELAASRLRSMPAREISAAMAGDWSGLRRSRANGRHASLAKAIEWSLSLLTADQHAFLAGLSVFRGDWTEADAVAVTGVLAADGHRHLAALVGVSIVQAQAASDGRLRFRLPRHVGDVIGSRLSDAEARQLRGRHRSCFEARATALAAQHGLIDQADVANAVEALTTALDDDDWDTTTRLALAMGGYWNACGLSQEASGLLRRIAAKARGRTDDAAVNLIGLAARLFVQSGLIDEARGFADLALRRAASPIARADALLVRVSVRWRVDREAAPLQADATEALRLARQSSSPALLRRALLQLGPLAASSGGPTAAAALFREAEAMCLQRGDALGALAALPGLTFCLIAEKKFLAAIELAQRGLEAAEGLRHVELQMLLFNRLGHCLEALRRYKQALVIYERQASLAREHGMAYHLAYGIWNQCLPLARLRRFEEAAMLMAFSKRYWLEHFGPIKPEDQAVLSQVREIVVDRTSRVQWRRHWAEGSALSLPEALALGAPRRA